MDFGIVPVTQRPDTQGPGQIVPRADFSVSEHRGKPPVHRSMFYCQRCHTQPQEVAHYAAQTGHPASAGERLSDEEIKAAGSAILDCGEGYIHGWVRCHGARAEFYASFAQAWMAHDAGQLIRVFDLPEGTLTDGVEKIAAPLPALPDRQPLTIDV